MNRRDVLKALGMAALGAGSACAITRPDGTPGAVSSKVRRLSRVRVTEDRVTRTVVGLRPFRRSGFVVRSERIDRKTVVHNYGHGGGGVTLSWGTAHMALEEARATGERRAAVLGAGAVGLATAILLQRSGFDVTIYAKDLPPNTTSNVAGAQWSPSEVFDPGATAPAFDAQFAHACRLSYRYFQDLIGDDYGVRWIDNYELSDAPFEDVGNRGSGSPIRDLYPGLENLTRRESPFDYPFVRRFATMFIEPPTYLNALVRDVLLAGGRVENRELASVDDVLSLPEPLVVNCTGLGARGLFRDDELMPIKGQLTVLLPQPEIDYIALKEELYMFPRIDGILLGSTYNYGVWDLEPDEDASRRIVEGHVEIFNRLKHA